MSTTQELIERLRVHEERMCFLFDMIVALRDKQTGELHESLNSMKYVLSGRPACVDEAADRLSEQAAELAAAERLIMEYLTVIQALKAKLAGVDEKGVEAGVLAYDMHPALHYNEECSEPALRAAIAAYLAALRDKG